MLIEVRQLFLDYRLVLLTRTDINVLLGQNFHKAVVSSLQLGAPRSEEVNKLFRILVAATGP